MVRAKKVVVHPGKGHKLDTTQNADDLDVKKLSSTTSCLFCGRTFTTPSRLKQHVKIHVVEKPFKCRVCSETFPTKEGLVNHEKTHAPPEQYFQCEFCMEKFTQKIHLEIHERTHTGQTPFRGFFHQTGFPPKDARVYTCDLCDKTFPLKGDLIVHMRNHRTDKPLTCDMCDMAFAYLPNLKAHLKRMHNIQDIRPRGPKGVAPPLDRLLERRVSDEPDSKWKCWKCQEGFRRQLDLALHSLKHVGESTDS